MELWNNCQPKKNSTINNEILCYVVIMFVLLIHYKNSWDLQKVNNINKNMFKKMEIGTDSSHIKKYIILISWYWFPSNFK